MLQYLFVKMWKSDFTHSLLPADVCLVKDRVVCRNRVGISDNRVSTRSTCRGLMNNFFVAAAIYFWLPFGFIGNTQLCACVSMRTRACVWFNEGFFGQVGITHQCHGSFVSKVLVLEKEGFRPISSMWCQHAGTTKDSSKSMAFAALWGPSLGWTWPLFHWNKHTRAPSQSAVHTHNRTSAFQPCLFIISSTLKYIGFTYMRRIFGRNVNDKEVGFW